MKPEKFVQEYYPYAKAMQQELGISAVFVLAQAAFESGWGDKAPGNMFFGIKDTDGINGNEQLIQTTEYHDNVNVKYPEVISITPCVVNGKKKFRYKVKDYFRKYDSPKDSFVEHGKFFLNNKRYKDALLVRVDPYKFADAIAEAGYATDPNYSKILKQIIAKIEDII